MMTSNRQSAASMTKASMEKKKQQYIIICSFFLVLLSCCSLSNGFIIAQRHDQMEVLSNNNCGTKRVTPVSRTSSLLYAGFGSSSTSKNKKKNKKTKKSSLLSLEKTSTKKSSEAVKEEPKGPLLDRFGLPIPTIDDIFPPPTEKCIPMTPEDETNLGEADLNEILKDYLQVDSSLFKKNGIENEQEMRVRLLHKSPPVLAIDNFFTDTECEEYKNMIEPKDTSSDSSLFQMNSATFSPLSQSKRTSTTWYCHYSQVSTLLAKARKLFQRKIDIKQIEEPQIVRYRNGEEFSWHYDEVPASSLVNGGQRIATLLVYLNTIEDGRGGGTVFRDLKSNEDTMLTMKPKMGSALLFFPAKKDGTPDERTLHKGEMMNEYVSYTKNRKKRNSRNKNESNIKGKNSDDNEPKMIAQIWIHERNYDAKVPVGNSQDDAKELVAQKEKELGLDD